MTIGQRIKIRREQKGCTLDELSRYAKVTRQTLSRYETGVINNIPSDKIESIAAALGTTPAYLMGWENASGEAAFNKDDLPGEKKDLIDKIKLMDSETVRALNQIADSIIDKRDK